MEDGAMNSGIKVISFTGPSGAGKSAIIRELLSVNHCWRLVTSYTSRGPRESDLPGEYRCRVAHEEFTDPARAEKFAWVVSAHGNYYGHLTSSITSALLGEYPPIWMLTLTPNAVEKFLNFTMGRGLPFFVLPPEEHILRARLEARGDSEEEIARRMEDCKKWEEEARASGLPYIFLDNDGTVEKTAGKLVEVLKFFGIKNYAKGIYK